MKRIQAKPIILLAEGATEPPRAVCLFSAGTVETLKGSFTVDGQACASVLAAYTELGRKLSFDFEHASVAAIVAPDPAAAGRSAGLFSVTIRDGAIWASDIEWTARAHEMITAREYCYISPAFVPDDESRVVEIVGAALTNAPATIGAPRLLALTGAATETEALAVVARWKEAATAATATPPKPRKRTSEETKLLARVELLEREKAVREVNELVTLALRERKISPALKPWAQKMPLVLFREFLAMAPAIVSTRPAREGDKDPDLGVAMLNKYELEGCRKVSMDPELFAAHKTKLMREGRLPTLTVG